MNVVKGENSGLMLSLNLRSRERSFLTKESVFNLRIDLTSHGSYENDKGEKEKTTKTGGQMANKAYTILLVNTPLVVAFEGK